MIIHRIGDWVYFENGGQKVWVHPSEIDFKDKGGGQCLISARPTWAMQGTYEFQGAVTSVTDINGNSYGSTIADIISAIASSSVAISTNNGSGDAFGRVRMSEPFTVFESKELDGSASRIWTSVINGTGTITKSDPNSLFTLAVSANEDFAIRQHFKDLIIRPGKVNWHY